jgi:hypothetical protein
MNSQPTVYQLDGKIRMVLDKIQKLKEERRNVMSVNVSECDWKTKDVYNVAKQISSLIRDQKRQLRRLETLNCMMSHRGYSP